MKFYLDASVIIPLFFNEETSQTLYAWFKDCTETLYISDFVVGEVASGISRRVRMKHLTQDQGIAAIGRFDLWRIRVAEPLENEPVDIRLAAQLIRQPFPKLLMPDAVHLATCHRLAYTLVTRDVKLTEVAEARGIAFSIPV